MLAEVFAQLSWSPVIIAASTNHVTRQQRSAKTTTSWSVNGVKWKFFWSPSYAKSPLLRLLNMGVFTVQLLRLSTARDLDAPDVVLGSTVHPFAAWAAALVARKFEVPFVFEVRDLWPETLIDMKAIKRNGLAARVLRRLERFLYRRASLIVVTMPAAYDYIARYGVEANRVVWISNGVAVKGFRDEPPPNRKCIHFVYCGAHGRANDLEAILEGFALALKALPNAAQLTLIGDGPMKERLMRRSQRLGLDQVVTFRGSMAKDEVPDALVAADALIISLLPLPLYRFGVSMNKLFDYLAAGRPIVLSGNPINNVVVDADAGVWSDSNKPEAIAKAIIQMCLASSHQRELWGKNGSRHARDNYSYDVLGHRFIDELNRLIGSAGSDASSDYPTRA